VPKPTAIDDAVTFPDFPQLNSTDPSPAREADGWPYSLSFSQNPQPFIDPDIPSRFSQQLVAGSYPAPAESSKHPQI
jgi:hypothetical protein